jgi:hypothetical protein
MIKPIGKFVKKTVRFRDGHEETFESELQEVTCDICGHTEQGKIGAFSFINVSDDECAVSFYVFDETGREQIMLYWEIADRDNAHACDNCSRLVNLLQITSGPNWITIPDEALNLEPMETYPFRRRNPEEEN